MRKYTEQYDCKKSIMRMLDSMKNEEILELVEKQEVLPCKTFL